MRQGNVPAPESAEKSIRDIRRVTRRHFSAEEKIRIVPPARQLYPEQQKKLVRCVTDAEGHVWT